MREAVRPEEKIQRIARAGGLAEELGPGDRRQCPNDGIEGICLSAMQQMIFVLKSMDF